MYRFILLIFILCCSCSVKEDYEYEKIKTNLRIGLNGKYCYDGDTCYIEHKNSNYKLRLKDIDTPEINSECKEEKELAIKARDELHKLLMVADSIHIISDSVDKYGRWLGDIRVNGFMVTDWLLMKGYGKKWTPELNWCKELKEVRNDKVKR